MVSSLSRRYSAIHNHTMKVLIFLGFFTLSLAIGDEDGQYVPDDSGRYVPSDEGQYVPDFSGQYIHDGLGNYKDDGTGKYAGQPIEKFREFKRNLVASSAKKVQVQAKPSPVPSSTPVPTTRYPPKTYDNYKEGQWRIIRKLEDADTDGYHWEFETENKIVAEESGKVHNLGTDNEAMRSKGFYQYTGPDNVVYSVEYTADENGFNPVGRHLPTPPPIPVEIAEALTGNNNKI